MRKEAVEPWLGLGAALCLLPVVAPWMALLGGLGFAVATRGTIAPASASGGKRLLAAAIVGTGLGLSVEPLRAAPAALLGGLAVVTGVFAAAALLGRLLGVDASLNRLLSAGAAVCGGSAIAAVAASTRAKAEDAAVALGIVFGLNAIAVLLFPLIGDALAMEPTRFGVWAAMAVHDTASVTATASAFGRDAVESATVWKLGRAVWILPLAMVLGARTANGAKAPIPWFIVAFAGAALVGATVNHPGLDAIAGVARRGFVAAIFLVGSSWRPGLFSGIGWKPFAQSAGIWVAWATLSLWVVERL